MGMQIPLFRFFEEAEEGGKGGIQGFGQPAGFAGVRAPVPGWVRGGAGWGAQGTGRPGGAGAGALDPPPDGHCKC